MSLDDAWQKVRAFHEAAGHPVGEKPRSLPPERVTLRARWMLEELHELEDAATTEAQVDALLDLLYFALGTLVEMGVKPARLFDIVHEANMAKAEGNERDPDGKVLKPKEWVDPTARLRDALAADSRSASN